MRKARVVIMLACFLVGCGLLAAVNFVPLLKNAQDYGRLYEWIGACLIGIAVIAGVLIADSIHSVPSPSKEMWGKHRPVKERLPNVHIGDMLRAERQFVLYGYPVSLYVLLALLMYDNQLNEDDISQNLSPLIEYREQNIWRYLPGILMKQQKQQQVKQREIVADHVMSSIENAVQSQHTTNGVQSLNLPPDSTNHRQAPNELPRYKIRTIIRMHLDGHRPEDIVEALDTGTGKRWGNRHLETNTTVNHSHA
jgi:hypothetical protein